MLNFFVNFLFLPLAFAAALSSAGHASVSSLRVVDALVARDVLARQPVGPGDNFPADVGTLVCWSKVFSRTVPIKLIHVWYYKGKETGRTVLDIKSSKWRGWSRKTIRPEQTGAWKVELCDVMGTVLQSVAFNVAGEAPSETQSNP
ncbi:MAG: DUF2914 domain-containing protein [Elusimicrobiota bacterium]